MSTVHNLKSCSTVLDAFRYQSASQVTILEPRYIHPLGDEMCSFALSFRPYILATAILLGIAGFLLSTSGEAVIASTNPIICNKPNKSAIICR
jgi:hypothetical protein